MWPIVLPLVGEPKAVVDFGAGSCDLLAQLIELRPEVDCIGVDHPEMPTDGIYIPRDCFIHADLSKPLDLGRRFDIATCLEAAEHLPPEAAETIVETLVRHSDTIIFSAAIPGQGGTGHLNEQWPSYWIERFAAHGYSCFDVLRPATWNNQNVVVWYRKNMLIFRNHSLLPHTLDDWGRVSIVHPWVYLNKHRKRLRLRLSRENPQR